MNENLYLFFIAHVLIGLTVFLLAFFVIIKNRSQVNVWFFVFFSSISLWAFFYAFWLLSDTATEALFLARGLNVFAIFIPVLYIEWLLRFVGKYKVRKVIILYLLMGIFLFFSYNSIFISEVKTVGLFPFFPQSGWLHKVFLIEWCVVILFSYYLLISQYRSAVDKNQKKQLLFILIGALVGFMGGSFNFLMMLDVAIVAPFGSLLVIVFPVMIGYAMTKHNLMDTRAVFMQALLIVMNISGLAIVLTSDSVVEYVFNALFVLMALVTSYLFVKSYNRTMSQKEKLEKVSKDLERANVELKRLDSAKSEFISIASHQLRTPLTAIKGYISLILEGAYGKNAPQTNDALNKIFLANERLIQLVEDLLNITHIEAGRLEYHVGDVHLEGILEELYDMFTLRAQDKGLDFVLNLSDGKLPIIQADKSKLQEVISNLIDNAIKYTNEGFVHVSVEHDERTIRIIVEDSGVGISTASMKTLFAKFSRGTDSSKIYTEGTGLGLFVGKNLIESQGGHVYAESDGVEKGSRFIIEMPIVKAKK